MDREVENTIPVLPVRRLEESRRFYVDTLGFQVDWGGGEEDTICQVSRDGHPIMLSQQGGIGSPAWVWIGLESDSLFREYQERGVVVHQQPADKPWAYEMKIADPDGNILWLGTEPRTEVDLEIE